VTDEEWADAERRIVSSWTGGDREGALRQIEEVLGRGGPEIQARALVYGGSILEEGGDAAGATLEFSRAAALHPPGSYGRYAAELSAGGSSELQRDSAAAIRWYRAALVTCSVANEPFSGGVALRALVKAQGYLLPEDKSVAEDVIRRSWQALKLPGSPDVTNVADAADALIRRASQS
jgi:hypothetical protein